MSPFTLEQVQLLVAKYYTFHFLLLIRYVVNEGGFSPTALIIVVIKGGLTYRCHHFVVPLGDSASISMLSYSQRHYDINF